MRRRRSNLEGYLKDFDPAIAQKAAEILTAWTGSPAHRGAAAADAAGRDASAMVNALRGKSLRFHMAGRGTSTSASTSMPRRSRRFASRAAPAKAITTA